VGGSACVYRVAVIAARTQLISAHIVIRIWEQKNFLSDDFSCKSKSGILKFLIFQHFVIYLLD
jgi:hypothetical protein